MLYTTYLLALSCVLFFCFVDYRGKVFDKILCVFMYFMMAYVVSNADLGAYYNMYDYIDNISKIGFTDPGFGLLMFLGRSAGLDYSRFLIVFTIIGILFVVGVFRKISNCPGMILAIYFAFLFPTFTVQIRPFIAETILYVLLYEVVYNEKFDKKNFFILLALSVAFHATSLFFVLVLLMGLIHKRKNLAAVIVLISVLVPASATILKYIPIPMIQQKIQYYFYIRKTVSVSVLAVTIAYITVMGYIYYRCSKLKGDWYGRFDRLLRINIVGIIACDMMLLFNSNFYRMIRIILMVDALVILNQYFDNGGKARKRIVLGGVFASFFFAYEILMGRILDVAMGNSFLASALGIKR